MQTQLLCTFCTEERLEHTLREIVENYNVQFDVIYVLESMDSPTNLSCTYNIELHSKAGGIIPDGTISLHRKKATNTLYTINALNKLILELNDGVLDKSFTIPWEDYRNTILVTAYGKLKIIKTELKKIVKIEDIF